MASTHTTNLGLNKPDRQDFVSVVTDINDNMDMIDTAIGDPSSASGVTGNDAFSKIGTLDSEKIDTSNIIDNLTTNDPSKPLSAAQGYALNSKTSAIQITNNYSTILGVINAYRNVMNYPFTIQKAGNSAYTDMPSEVSQTCEWNLVCTGDKDRTTAVLTIYTGGSSANGWSYTANIYQGNYIYNWSSLNSKITKHSKSGITTCDLPLNARNVVAIARYGTSGGLQLLSFVFPIGVANANISGLILTQGYYLNTTSYGFCQISYNSSTEKITIGNLTISGTNFSSTSEISVTYEV